MSKTQHTAVVNSLACYRVARRVFPSTLVDVCMKGRPEACVFKEELVVLPALKHFIVGREALTNKISNQQMGSK